MIGVNISGLPLTSSCDSTRLQMAAKQISQTLTHKNCEIPYVIGEDYYRLLDSNGIFIAPDDGVIVFNTDGLIIMYFKNLNKLKVKEIPEIQKTGTVFGSSLRYSMPAGTKFNKGDIIFSYDCFRDGIPSFGYNVFTGFFSFFGFNHEDSIVISEDFAKRSKFNMIDKVYVPISEYTLLRPLYSNVKNSLVYFPNINQKITNDVVCSKITPKHGIDYCNSTDIKSKMMMMVMNMSISDLAQIKKDGNIDLLTEDIKCKFKNGTVSGIKVHKIRNDVELLDKNLQRILDFLHNEYISNNVAPNIQEISEKLSEDYSRLIAKKYYIYNDKTSFINGRNLSDFSYLLELEITKDNHSEEGDKFCNRYAGKGVISLILPNELRPFTIKSARPLDLIFNPFGIMGRMNISQILEGIISKNVESCSNNIKNGSDPIEIMNWLHNNIISVVCSDKYIKNSKNYINKMASDKNVLHNFLESVNTNNLFIECPSFMKINTKQLVKNSISPIEKIVLSRQLLLYIKDKLNIDIPYPLNDAEINVFCSPIYFMKLHKIASHLWAARDTGPYKSVTKQPIRGRSKGQASRLGQMEMEGLISHGVLKTLKEFLTVKSDHYNDKPFLFSSLIDSGTYNLPDHLSIEGGTKRVVSTLIKFLNS